MISPTIIVVTYNRLNLLRNCLEKINSQTHALHKILAIDNSSTDGSINYLNEIKLNNLYKMDVLLMAENTGGAGGFSSGMKAAFEQGADWIWMMDDDAAPHPNALAELLKIAKDPNTIYGSLAVNGVDTSWATILVNPPLGLVPLAKDVPAEAEVEMLPFLGFMIHRSMVEKIGLPDAGFFIAADDAEYCLRARRAGAKIVIAGKSHIEHPKTQTQTLNVLGRKIIYLSLPPWKRYYDTRNRLLIARKYHGMRLWTEALPGTFVRLIAAMIKEPRKLAQLHAFVAAVFDGLLGLKGKRHESWGIRQ